MIKTTFLSYYIRRVFNTVFDSPILVSTILYLFYFLIFQSKIVLIGDIWAETHAEYLAEALKNSVKTDIFTPGWAGYWTILPSLFSQLYVKAGFSIGHIDYFYQAITLTTVFVSTVIINAKWFRGLIKNDYLRLMLGLGFLLILYEKSTLSIINIWYICFLPIILAGLNPNKLSMLGQAGYSLIGMLLALTKPSLIIIPFAVYRIIRTKEYLSGGIVVGAALLQLAIMLTLDPRESMANATHNIVQITQAIFTGGGVALFKLFRIEPTEFYYN